MSTEGERTDPWGSFEPYAQLIRSLMPRANSVFVFDAEGELRWTSETTTGPDLVNLVADVLPNARQQSNAAGELRVLEGNLPVYFCWLRNDAQALIAIVAVVCRPSASGELDPARSFSLAHAFLRPALECLRRDLIARSLIDDLNRSVTSLDKDLALLLTDAAGSRTGAAADNADELKSLVQQAMDHLECVTAALIVPDKGIVIMRSGAAQSSADNQLVARTHRQLLSMAQLRKQPVIINRLSANGHPVPYRILSCPLVQTGGRAVGLLALFRSPEAAEFTPRDARIGDILARKAHSIIESNYDAMSGLYTRPAFEQRVRAVVANAKKNAQWSALYIDTDQLHVINDNFGMHVGDTVIRQLGELIRRRLAPGAFAARISGDRFAALLPTGLDDAGQFAESLREGAEKLGGVQGEQRMQVSVSIGVAPLDTAASELMHSLAAAETACKAAKDRGRNRVETYQTNDPSVVRRFADVNIAARLRTALSEDRLRLEAQLIAPFANGEGIRPYYELLLRMIDEDGQTLGPDRFLSAANRFQLMPTIDRWVIEKALELLAPYAPLLASRPVGFAINLSGQSLNDDAFGDFLFERLEHCGLDPSIFCFELTENATIANVGRAENLMRRLRRLGCSVALDDFGTGLSSLSYLRQLPVTALKIDGSFVRDILRDARSESMVQAIAQLARGMSIATVAEYVETEELRHRVAALGVDYGQGFAFGRPKPLQEVLSELPLLAAVAEAPSAPADDPLLDAQVQAAVANLH
jgi:diguanylate cyclase (GGDEF)-like protein